MNTLENKATETPVTTAATETPVTETTETETEFTEPNIPLFDELEDLENALTDALNTVRDYGRDMELEEINEVIGRIRDAFDAAKEVRAVIRNN